MTSLEAISELVDAAITLDREIREAEGRLKQMKRKLVCEAQLRPTCLETIPDGGQALEFQGNQGAIARVILPKQTLKKRIEAEGKQAEKVRAIAGADFARLFQPETGSIPVDNFRARAVEILGAARAHKLLALMTTRSEPRVVFETKPTQS